MKKIMILLTSLSLLLVLGACTTGGNDDEHASTSEGAIAKSSETHPIVSIIMENDDAIEIELYPEVAPNTVNNFISLIEDEYYNGVSFHRVIPGFMIQGGDPDGTGQGGPGYAIKGEFSDNAFENNLSHTRGVISMARTNEPDSAGSQFFIIHEDSFYLDDEYAAFGEVIEGMDHVDQIVKAETDGEDMPVSGHEQIMKEVSVDLKGKTYSAPKIID